MTPCRKATVQNGRSAEMGNVPIVLNSRVTEWHDVTKLTINNQLNKQLKDITYNENTILFRSYYYELLFRIMLTIYYFEVIHSRL